MSRVNRNIEEEIRKAFEEGKASAPSGIWENISKQSQLSDDEKMIHDAYASPKDNWSIIQKNIVINEVWKDLSVQLDKRKKAIPYWFIDTGVLVILFLLFFNHTVDNRYEQHNLKLSPVQMSYHEEYHSSEKATSNDKHFEDKSKITGHVLGARNDNYSSEYSYVQQLKGGNIHKNAEQQKIGLNQIKKKDHHDKVTTQSIPDHINLVRNQVIRELPILKVNRLETDSVYQKLNDMTPPFSKVFSLGVQVEVGNSWIINNSVRNGLNSESLSQTKFSAGWGLGILAKYDFNRRFGVKAEYLFLNELNQNYSKFENGMFNEYGIRLRMNKFRLSGTVSFLNDKKHFSDFHFGGFVSHIGEKQINVIMNADVSQSDGSFKNLDYGLTFGLDMHHQLNNRYNLFYGIFSDVGLANLHSNQNSNIPAKFNYTNTFIIGLRGGLQINW